MNRDRIQERLTQVSGIVKKCWGCALRDETMRNRGDRDRWVGRMQRSYGIVRDMPLLPGTRSGWGKFFS
jgi:uncharacterized protein YjbJ (UPF0337 family)